MSNRSILGFDGISINGVGYGASLDNTCKFVPDSGTITANPEITRSPCDSGRITYRQLYKDFTISCQLIGDYTSLNTDAKDQDLIKLFTAGTERIELVGTVSAEFDDGTNETSITVTGKIRTSPEPLTEAVVLDGSSAETALGS